MEFKNYENWYNPVQHPSKHQFQHRLKQNNLKN